MKTFAAAVVGLFTCVQLSSAYTVTADEGPFKKLYFKDIWGNFHEVPDSVPARVYLQWLYPQIAPVALAASSVSIPTQLAELSYSPPAIEAVPASETGGSAAADTVVFRPLCEAPITPPPVIPTNGVPDGGSTLILFSGALGVLGWFQRRGCFSPKVG
jgi:hypothetical protein